MKPTNRIIILDLASVAGICRMKNIISRIQKQQPQAVLITSDGHLQDDRYSLKYRDQMLAKSERFIESTFSLRTYQEKARKMIQKFAENLDESNWWHQSVVLITKLLHLALTEEGNPSLWIDAQQFLANDNSHNHLQELWNYSQGQIVISQDTLAR